MKFGSIPTPQASGAVLAHTLRVPGAGVFKKGHVLSAADAAVLSAAGHEAVIGARLEEGDVAENEAAARVAAAVAGDGARPDAASTGRCNLRAETRGLVVVDRERVDRLNRIHESLTFACVEPFTVVEARTMIATVKIIPFAVPRDVVERWVEGCAGGRAPIRVAPLRGRAAGLVLTELPGVKQAVIDRAAQSQHTRMARLGCCIKREIRCPHDPARVAEAIRRLQAEGCDPILLLGSSAIVDRKDVIPAAVVAAGGSVDHLGMPVDPGNLLMLGRVGPARVIGVPGCARSLKPSGFDWVLRRVVADVPVGSRDLMGMGVGGLLLEPPGRPHPRAGGRIEPQRPPQVGAVVLAAGRSRRMGRANKLLSVVDGQPMVSHVVDTALASGVRPVVVVTGHEEQAVREALSKRPVSFAHNPDYGTGMSSSLRVGLDVLGDKGDAALVFLGDMPWVRREHVEALLAAFEPRGERPICVPVHDRKRGNPVLWPTRYFKEMRRLEGDLGARRLLDHYADEVTYVPVADEGINLDVDTPDALAALAGPGGHARPGGGARGGDQDD